MCYFSLNFLWWKILVVCRRMFSIYYGFWDNLDAKMTSGKIQSLRMFFLIFHQSLMHFFKKQMIIIIEY